MPIERVVEQLRLVGQQADPIAALETRQGAREVRGQGWLSCQDMDDVSTGQAVEVATVGKGGRARKQLIASFAEQARDYVRRELESIRQDFFGASIKKIDTLRKRLDEAERRVSGSL